jgi:hypothetical protein
MNLRPLVFAGALLAACGSPPATIAPPPVASIFAAAPVPEAAASATATAVASPPAAPPPPALPPANPEIARRSHRRADAGGCPDHARGMAVGRKRAAAGDHQAALEAFTEALRARPFDARAWAELGYVAMLAGRDASGPLLLARSLTRDRALLAPVWFNEGLYRAQRGDAEGARLALVMAEANGSKPAADKLGAASRCAATWTTDAKVMEEATIVASWRDVLTASGSMCVPDPAPATEAEARQAVCLGCNGMGSPGTTDLCTGPGPWTVPTGYMHFHIFRALIQPLTRGGFFVDTLSDGESGAEMEPAGPVLSRRVRPARTQEIALAEPDEPRLTNSDHWSDDGPTDNAPDDAGAYCKPSLDADVPIERVICAQCFQPAAALLEPVELRYYAPRTGREILRLTVWNGDVRAAVANGVATISGGGCQATVTVASR